MSRIISRLRDVLKAMNEPPAPQCRQCHRTAEQVTLAVGAELCANCSRLTPAERERFERNLHGLEQPHRRRDDPRR